MSKKSPKQMVARERFREMLKKKGKIKDDKDKKEKKGNSKY